MSETWDKDSKETLEAPVASDGSDTPDAPESVQEVPTVPPTPQQPQTFPINGMAPDGSYQYVPPRRPPVPPVYQAPPPQYYRPVVQQPAPQQQPEPSPKQPKSRPENGWVVVLAIVAALAVVISGVLLAGEYVGRAGGNAATGTTSVADGSTTTTTGTKPSTGVTPGELQQNPPPVVPDVEDDAYCDGGYTTEYIVNKNYHSSVVLSMYMNMDSFPYYDGGGLQEVGAASGIVWTADGIIITNCHCVIDEETGQKYDRIDVTTYDGTVYKDAQVIGADSSTDLAVIKVDATNLIPAEFGDSDQLAVGSRVVALGNAAGLSWTATQGIVSAKARDVYEDTGYAIRCLQVDVAINSGNSGGPLLNKYGQVIAINSAKIAASGYEGLGFAIPINEARPVLESLRENGYVTGRVSLGIRGDTYNDGFYQGYGIVSIDDPSGWDTETEQWEYDRRAGKLTLIVAVDDVKVVDYGTLRAELAKHKVGDTVTLKLLHFDQYSYDVTTHYVKVTLKEQKAN